jgi:hypothetical protein
MVPGDYNQGEDIFVGGIAGPAFTDSDGDGMDDAWEMQFFHTLARDGSGDFDGDGATDLAEFLAGTDPTDADSYLHMHLSVDRSGSALLTWPVVRQRTYRVEYKQDLGDSAWTDLAAPLTIIGDTAHAFDSSLNSAQRFYRLVLLH